MRLNRSQRSGPCFQVAGVNPQAPGAIIACVLGVNLRTYGGDFEAAATNPVTLSVKDKG